MYLNISPNGGFMNKAQAKVAVGIRFDPETYQKLENDAYSLRNTVGGLVVKIVMDYVSRLEPKESIEKKE